MRMASWLYWIFFSDLNFVFLIDMKMLMGISFSQIAKLVIYFFEVLLQKVFFLCVDDLRRINVVPKKVVTVR